MEKMTYVKALDAVLNGDVMTAEIVEKLKALKASLTKKNSGERKATKTQLANKVLQDAILDAMEIDRLYSISEMEQEIPGLEGLSSSKITSLLTPLKRDGLLVRETGAKGKALYRLAKQGEMD